MTLHENLERKRRQNIRALNESGACHLCGCTGTRSISSFVGDDDCDCGAPSASDLAPAAQDVQEEGAVPMRTCMCYGNTASWPFSLRVCEMCISDDVKSCTGRVRCCGICGVVACDENCGVELVEVTDRDEWDQRGCLECRGMESFSEMELFRKRPTGSGLPRATRVCRNCLELFSLFSFGTQYHFTCRYFRCSNLLVPSHVVELKRSMTPFPLAELPEELLNSIVDYLGGRDLFSFGRVCTSLFRKVEKVSREIVTAFHHQVPTGPVHVCPAGKDDGGGSSSGASSSSSSPPSPPSHRRIVYAEGKNRHSLRPPEDGKTWIGVLNQMEQLTRDAFYFDFQVSGGDDGAPMRYLRDRNKLCFDRVFMKPVGTGPIVPYFEHTGLSVRGGQVLVTRYKLHSHVGAVVAEAADGEPQQQQHQQHQLLMQNQRPASVRSIIFAADRPLESGVHRVIVRYYCVCDGETLGSLGILRQRQEGSGVPGLLDNGPSVAWQTSMNIVCQGRMEEHVFGMEYDADRRTLMVYKRNARTSKMVSTTDGRAQPVPVLDGAGGGTLCFAAALSSTSAGIKGNQLSMREVGEGEWAAFLAHTAERNVIHGMRGRRRRGEERLMRYLDHRARRAFHHHGFDDFVDHMEMLAENDMIDREIEALEADEDDAGSDFEEDEAEDDDVDVDDDNAVEEGAQANHQGIVELFPALGGFL